MTPGARIGQPRFAETRPQLFRINPIDDIYWLLFVLAKGFSPNVFWFLWHLGKLPFICFSYYTPFPPTTRTCKAPPLSGRMEMSWQISPGQRRPRERQRKQWLVWNLFASLFGGRGEIQFAHFFLAILGVKNYKSWGFPFSKSIWAAISHFTWFIRAWGAGRDYPLKIQVLEGIISGDALESFQGV